MSKTATPPRTWSNIEDDFIRISGPILATADLLAEATSFDNFEIAGLRDGTICNIADQCVRGIQEIQDLFYETHALYVQECSKLKEIEEEAKPKMSELESRKIMLQRLNEHRRELKSEIRALKAQEDPVSQ
ncbi:MAG: hypothetical protein ABW134_17000 [Candidatus Thiodiazotropha endolucinida]